MLASNAPVTTAMDERFVAAQSVDKEKKEDRPWRTVILVAVAAAARGRG